MRTSLFIIALILAVISLISCSGSAVLGGLGVGSHKTTYGKAVDETMLSNIKKGSSTSADILAWFGSPTVIAEAGANDLYVFKQCQYGGTSVGGGAIGAASSVAGLGGATKSSSKEKCNELTVIIDKSTDKVVDYKYIKEFKK